MAPDRYADQSWFGLINGAQTFLIDEFRVLPGPWAGPGRGSYNGAGVCPSLGCPAEFPFRSHGPSPYAENICYSSAEDAAKGEGPCGSWCTRSINVGDGCGDNRGRLCGGGSCTPGVGNVSACEALCDSHAGCNAVDWNSTAGCCLHACPPGAVLPPNATAGSCCGYWRKDSPASIKPSVLMRAIDIVGLSRSKALLWEMPLQAGHIVATGLKLLPDKAAPAAEQAWVLDRLMRYGLSLAAATTRSRV